MFVFPSTDLLPLVPFLFFGLLSAFSSPAGLPSEEDDVGIDPTLYARGGQIEGLGGLIEGPGTGTSDDIPAMIYQDGNPVQEAMLSNGEVVLSLKDLRNIGGGDAEMAGKMIGDAPNGTRGAVAAKLFRNMQEFKNG